MKKSIAWLLTLLLVLSLAGCGQAEVSLQSEEASSPIAAAEETTALPAEAESDGVLAKVDMSRWKYNSENDVYWQVGLAYCSTPKDESYETMGFYVPGAYFDATDNGDGTYTCVVNTEATVNGYDAKTAPVIVPVNTPGYSAMSAPTGFKSFGYGNIGDYTAAGFVLAVPGARGRDAGAPAGVTDFKAAIRYTRYNEGLVPGNMNAIFTEGMSGGGAQSAVIGATGNNSLYEPYLQEIGALEGISDSVMGSMCWCPITNLDTADAAYEWNMGVTRSNLSAQEQLISDGLAASYRDTINNLGLRDADGNVLILEASENGTGQAGSYYDLLVRTVEESLNHFLEDTEFPYTPSSGNGGGPGGGSGNGPGGQTGSGNAPNNATGSGNSPDAQRDEIDYEAQDDITRKEVSGGVTLSGTYDTAQDYIDALNANGEWVIYDAESKTVQITSLASFSIALKQASKNLGAFDQLDGGQGENVLFGYGDGSGAHFDATLAALLEDIAAEEAADYASDLEKRDAVGNTVELRVNMYTPLYYLLESQAGYCTSDVAPYWRIRSGINQGDTALCTEVNLALALAGYPGVSDVDFETVWGLGHTTAERAGDSTGNFIAWVDFIMKNQ